MDLVIVVLEVRKGLTIARLNRVLNGSWSFPIIVPKDDQKSRLLACLQVFTNSIMSYILL